MLRIDKAILDTDRVVCDNIRQLSGTDTITYKLTNQQFILNIVKKLCNYIFKAILFRVHISLKIFFVDFLLSLGYTSYGR